MSTTLTLPPDWEERHRVVPPDHPPVEGTIYRCIRCDREAIGRYPLGRCPGS